MSDSRQGLNCTLSYMYGRTRRAYRVRATVLTHGMQIIYDESQARVRQSFYPHRLSSAQFMVAVTTNGEDEYRSLVNWLTAYADYILDIDLREGEFPSMAVALPSENFLRKGVPLSGFEWSDAVGKMVWDMSLVFETAGEPGDEKGPRLSSVQGWGLYDQDTKYFYPTGTQLSGNDAPKDGTYASPVTIQDILPTGSYGMTNGGRSTHGGTTAD